MCYQSNTAETHRHRSGGIMVWVRLSLGGHTDLHVIHGRTPTNGMRFLMHITAHMPLLLVTVSFWWIIMHDLTELWLWLLKTIFEGYGLERPARSPNLNPIADLCDYLCRQAASSPPPRSLDDAEQCLLCVFFSFPISVFPISYSDNLIDNMESLCR